MKESWYLLSDLKNSDNNITANAVVPIDSPWFSGHFPGEPVLPGIAELSIVSELIKKYYHKKDSFKILSFKKIRFKYLVKPGELLNIIVTAAEKLSNTYSFKITKDGNIACSGTIVIE